MALSALKASQLATLLAGHAKMFTANNPGQNEFADYLLRSGQSATMGLLAEEEEKKRKKKEKGALGGKIGSALGTAAGIALAGPTFGASLGLSAAAGGALAGSLGGGLGGLAGQYAMGGSPSATSFALDAAQGGLSGYNYGKAGELANSVQTSGVTPDIPASPPIGQKISDGIVNALPNANVLSGMGAGGVMPGTGPVRNVADAYGVTPGTGPLLQPGQAGVASAAQRTRPSFGNRFMGALGQTLAPQQPTRPYGQLAYTTPGGIQVYR